MANSPRANHASLNPRRANILDRPEQHRFTPLVQDHLEPQPGRVVLSRRKLGELLRDSQLNLHLGGEPGDPASVMLLAISCIPWTSNTCQFSQREVYRSAPGHSPSPPRGAGST